MSARQRPGLADLRPNATVQCLHCEQARPAAGAVKFHSHQVCAACVAKLKLKETV